MSDDFISNILNSTSEEQEERLKKLKAKADFRANFDFNEEATILGQTAIDGATSFEVLVKRENKAMYITLPSTADIYSEEKQKEYLSIALSRYIADKFF